MTVEAQAIIIVIEDGLHWRDWVRQILCKQTPRRRAMHVDGAVVAMTSCVGRARACAGKAIALMRSESACPVAAYLVAGNIASCTQGVATKRTHVAVGAVRIVAAQAKGFQAGGIRGLIHDYLRSILVHETNGSARVIGHAVADLAVAVHDDFAVSGCIIDDMMRFLVEITSRSEDLPSCTNY